MPLCSMQLRSTTSHAKTIYTQTCLQLPTLIFLFVAFLYVLFNETLPGQIIFHSIQLLEYSAYLALLFVLHTAVLMTADLF